MIANILKNLSKRFLRFGAAQMKISDVDERPKSYLNVDVDKMFSISIWIQSSETLNWWMILKKIFIDNLVYVRNVVCTHFDNRVVVF